MLHEQEREQNLGLRGEDSSSTEMETMASCFALSGFINARSVRSVCTWWLKDSAWKHIKQPHRTYVRLWNKTRRNVREELK